jgi:predicted nucleotidyltransferase
VSTKTLAETRAELKLLMPTLKKLFKVETVEIFGSYARGEQSEESDVDILVTYSQMVSFFTVYDLEKYLRRKLCVKVDIVSKKFLNPYLQDRVLQEAVPV